MGVPKDICESHEEGFCEGSPDHLLYTSLKLTLLSFEMKIKAKTVTKTLKVPSRLTLYTKKPGETGIGALGGDSGWVKVPLDGIHEDGEWRRFFSSS